MEKSHVDELKSLAWDFACIRYAGSVYDEAVVSSRNFVHIRITRANVNMPGHIFNILDAYIKI